MTVWAKTLYALAQVYLAACALPKLSILVLYRRIFTDKPTRIATWVLIILVLANWVAVSIAAFLQCIPVAAMWDPSIKGKCINLELLYRMTNLPILFTDLPMLILPFPSLWKLQASNARKWGLSFIFLCGGM